jgi:hypothetical protein
MKKETQRTANTTPHTTAMILFSVFKVMMTVLLDLFNNESRRDESLLRGRSPIANEASFLDGVRIIGGDPRSGEEAVYAARSPQR